MCGCKRGRGAWCLRYGDAIVFVVTWKWCSCEVLGCGLAISTRTCCTFELSVDRCGQESNLGMTIMFCGYFISVFRKYFLVFMVGQLGLGWGVAGSM